MTVSRTTILRCLAVLVTWGIAATLYGGPPEEAKAKASAVASGPLKEETARQRTRGIAYKWGKNRVARCVGGCELEDWGTNHCVQNLQVPHGATGYTCEAYVSIYYSAWMDRNGEPWVDVDEYCERAVDVTKSRDADGDWVIYTRAHRKVACSRWGA